MSKAETASAAEGRSRSAWVSIFLTVLLLVQLLRLTKGFGHWESLLPTAALLIEGLPRVFQLKGLAKQISQVVCWVILIVFLIIIIIQW